MCFGWVVEETSFLTLHIIYIYYTLFISDCETLKVGSFLPMNLKMNAMNSKKLVHFLCEQTLWLWIYLAAVTGDWTTDMSSQVNSEGDVWCIILITFSSSQRHKSSKEISRDSFSLLVWKLFKIWQNYKFFRKVCQILGLSRYNI